MNYSLRRILPKGIISLLFLSFYLIGGCDVEFGNSNNSGGGGGGGGGSQIETIEGTVADIIPDQDVEGVTVTITLDNTVTETDVTNASGFFSIDGAFAGNPQVSFTDSNSMPLGTIVINAFPTAVVNLGDITLDSGTVNLQDQTEVTFDGNVTVNNCTGNSGSLEVEAKNDQGKTTVIVQISASTDLINNGKEITCEDIIVGRSVEVQGNIPSGNTVDASRVELN
jgi:hypothetical protein